MNRFFKQSIKAALSSPLGFPFQRLAQGKCVCLMYHRVVSDQPRSDGASDFEPNRELMVKVSQFREQLKCLAANRQILSMSEAVSRLENGSLPDRAAVITFDDGHNDFLKLALPVLKEFQAPATLYVTTGLIDRSARLWWYDQERILKSSEKLSIQWENQTLSWDLSTPELRTAAAQHLNRVCKDMDPEAQSRFMDALHLASGTERSYYPEEALTWEELQALSRDPLVTIGAHTINHYVLSRVSESVLKDEMERSRSILELKLGHPVRHFAYPFGESTEAGTREFQMAKSLGFASAVTTRTGLWHEFHRSSLHSLPRVAVSYNDDLKNFKWKLSGLDSLVHRPGSRFNHD